MRPAVLIIKDIQLNTEETTSALYSRNFEASRNLLLEHSLRIVFSSDLLDEVDVGGSVTLDRVLCWIGIVEVHEWFISAKGCSV